MPTADTADEFERKWNSHLDDLERLKYSVPTDKMELFDEIDEQKERLQEIVAEIADHYEDDDASG